MYKSFGFWFINAFIITFLFLVLLLVFVTEGTTQQIRNTFTALQIMSIVGLPMLSGMLITLLITYIDGRNIEVAAATIVFTITIICIVLFNALRGDTTPYVVAWFGSLWSVMLYVITTRNNRTNNTLKLLVELRTNALLHRHRMNIFSKLGYTSALTEGMLAHLIIERDECKNWEDNVPVYESIAFISNLYDNIAYGVRHHDLDWHVVEKNIRNLIVFFFEDYYAFIEFHNKQNSKSLEHLIWLADKFGARRPGKC